MASWLLFSDLYGSWIVQLPQSSGSRSVSGFLGTHSTEFSSGSLFSDRVFCGPSAKWPSLSFAICFQSLRVRIWHEKWSQDQLYKYDGTSHPVVTRLPYVFSALKKKSFLQVLCTSNVFTAKKYSYLDSVSPKSDDQKWYVLFKDHFKVSFRL